MRSEKIYDLDEIADLLERAKEKGFSLEKGSELEQMTLEELDRLVNTKQ